MSSDAKFDCDSVLTKMKSIETVFTSFSDCLSEINGNMQAMINASVDSAVFGNYGAKMLEIWNQNASTFGDFHANFTAWSEVVSVIASAKQNFAVETSAMYRNNGGNLDGVNAIRDKAKDGKITDIGKLVSDNVSKTTDKMFDMDLDKIRELVPKKTRNENIINEFTYYNQGSGPWAGMVYGNGNNTTYQQAGCGPVSAAMVAAYLTGKKITPIDAGKYATANGYRGYQNGTAYGFFPSYGKSLGLNVTTHSKGSGQDVIDELNNGSVITLHINTKGKYSKSGGHFLDIIDYKTDNNGKTYVYLQDPGNRSNNGWNDLGTLMNNSDGLFWAYSKK